MEKSQPIAVLDSSVSVPNQLLVSVRAVFAQWPSWWFSLTWAQKLFPALAISLYWSTLWSLQGLRGDHYILGTLLLVLSYSGPILKPVLRFGFPFILTAIVYDSMRFYADYLRGFVHVSEPYLFDKYFFGISTAQGILTPNEWWQLHTHPVLDLIAGFAYLVFFAVFIFVSVYFSFFIAKKGTKKVPAAKLSQTATLMPWSFFWLNVLGYTTYYWYAAAPPWYITLYGLGPADMSAPANSAGCARFDQLLGTHFFSEMYGRAADVFGAIPSLHVAYPFLAVYFAFRYGTARAFCVGFYLLMCFSAVYLNHHFILDILWGSAYALIIGWLTFRYVDFRAQRQMTHATNGGNL